jgi:AhpD family alkylhydroperoxidase
MGKAEETLKRFQKGMGALLGENGQTVGKMGEFMSMALSEGGALTLREKELVAVGAALVARCDECIVVHVQKALQAGCTRQEILEAAGVAKIFGGGPVLAAAATILVDALDEFGGKA